MVRGIRLYIEGGGDGKNSRQMLQRGFGAFLREVREVARQKRMHWNLIASGSRRQAWEDFETARSAFPEDFVGLLVDSEEAVTDPPWIHLQKRDQWETDADDGQCHLMVQTMEAWLIADRERLAAYFGKNFRESALPAPTQNVERVPKVQLARALNEAAKNTAKRGYHKINDGCVLLEWVRLPVVQQNASFCNRLATALLQVIASA